MQLARLTGPHTHLHLRTDTHPHTYPKTPATAHPQASRAERGAGVEGRHPGRLAWPDLKPGSHAKIGPIDAQKNSSFVGLSVFRSTAILSYSTKSPVLLLVYLSFIAYIRYISSSSNGHGVGENNTTHVLSCKMSITQSMLKWP